MRKKNKLIQGVGVNDADYYVIKTGKGKIVWRCPYYKTWSDMLKRAYSDIYKKNSPTYVGVTVFAEWHYFTAFKAWMEAQVWEGKQLDKDILFQGNKVYSPDTCVFVDGVVNTFLIDRAAARGVWPLGVHWDKQKQKLRSECGNPFTKRQEFLGYFHCPQEAHFAWKKRKHELACQLADIQTDERVANALRTRYQ